MTTKDAFKTFVLIGQNADREQATVCSYLDFYQRLSLENEKADRLFVRANFQRPTMYFSPYSVIVRVRIYFLLTYIHVFALSKSRLPGIKKPRCGAVF